MEVIKRMKKMRNGKIVLLFSLILTIVSFVFADYRYYAWTYQFMTMLPGRTELEFYTRMDQSDLSKPETAKWKRQLEIETGITYRWDFSFYLVDSYKVTDSKTKFDEIKLRTRYKLAQKDQFIVDPILYIEYKIQADRSYPDKWETKLILAKDVGKLNTALNVIPEEYYKTGTKEKDWKVEYAYGISYPVVSETFRLGVEVKGDLKDDKHSIGPTVSFKGKNIWAAIGTVFGLNEKTDDMQVQAIIGILF
jgi:hypothetical protein